MRARTLLATVSAIALIAGAYVYTRTAVSDPPTMEKTGETDDGGVMVRRKTIDWQVIVREAMAAKAAFLTMTLSRDIVRDQDLRTSIRYTPFPDSTARIRVKYHVEYPIGYVFGKFTVTGGDGGLVITLHKPRLIARPSVKLLSYEVLDSGLLIDEKTALLALQQQIQPEAERLAKAVLRRPDVIPVSEAELRGFLTPILKQAGSAPPITFVYR